MKIAHRAILLLVLLTIILVSLFGIRNPYRLRTTLSYITRPVWDTFDYPSRPIANFATDELFHSQPPDSICSLHNNSRPRVIPMPELWDAIIFSHEVEMLEIHFMELEDVVDRFVILESDITYSGQPKRLYFEENRSRFQRWSDKISYYAYTHTSTAGFSFQPGDFSLETQQRNAMTAFIESLGIREDTLVLVADVDEIPYANTLRLLKLCQLPSPLHLQLNPYVYSFEFLSGDLDSWHIQVHAWKPGLSYYKHSSKSTEDYITDAGVHCSFCFKYISDFQFKMKAYSHSDRLGDDPESLLRPERIQDAICDGRNIFGMLPEAYTFLDLFTRWKGSAARLNTARHAPRPVKAEPLKYSYLLPGGCKRQMHNPLESRAA